METYQDYFNYEALKDFNLYVNDYIDAYEHVGEIFDDIQHTYSIPLSKKDYKKVIDILNEEKDKIRIMCDNPQALTIQDRQQIHNIHQFLNKDNGKLRGYFRQRKQKTNDVIKEYKEIALQNRMFMLVNRDEIFDYIDKIINSCQVKYNKEKVEHQELRDQYIKDWQKTYYICECGEQLQKVSKARHERTKTHQNYIKSLNPAVELKCNEYSWHKEKYMCSCGKEVSKGNKSTHEKSKYHQFYKCNETTPQKQLIIDTNDRVNNIVLTIGEKNQMMDKCVSIDSNDESSSDDDGFKYF